MRKVLSALILLFFSAIFIAAASLIASVQTRGITTTENKAANTGSQAKNAASLQKDPTPTSWLPDPSKFQGEKATMAAGMVATQQAGVGLPTLDPQQNYPAPFGIADPKSVLGTKPHGRIAGAGILTTLYPMDQTKNDDPLVYEEDVWIKEDEQNTTSVTSGAHAKNPKQGAVDVDIHSRQTADSISVRVDSPEQVGSIKVVGAVDDRLILKSKQNKVLYFDVDSLTFVNSLNEVVPTVTPAPTSVPPDAHSAMEGNDDAPDIPTFVYSLSPVNTDLSYFIDSPGDDDWFRFQVEAPGTLQISLLQSPGSYGIRVVHLNDATIVGEDQSPASQDRRIVLRDAPAGEYLVRVESLGGAFSKEKPYVFRFDTPAPEKITPILKCVADNGDGTYIAYFGYNNPNPFVVTVPSGKDNRFIPGSGFRTGQPETFAPGLVADWFGVQFDGKNLKWVVQGNEVKAEKNAPKCIP